MKRKFKVLLLIALGWHPTPLLAKTPEELILERATQFTVFIERVTTVPFNAARSGYGSGAGFIMDAKQGLVVTNRHVAVQGLGQTKLHFKNQAEAAAQTIYIDARYDLAVLKFDPTQVRAKISQAQIGDSSAVPVGRPVATFGNPFEFRFSASKGIISATDRRDPSASGFNGEFFQTDAEINPGNSGGPLIDLTTGEVIGINTFDWFDTNSNKVPGLGFSLKINAVRSTLQRIAQGNFRPQVGWVGMDLYEIPRHRVIRHYGIASHQAERDKYLLIGRITSGSPAQEAGFKNQDLILETAPKSDLRDETDLENLFNSNVGAKVKLKVLRQETTGFVPRWLELRVFNKNEDRVKQYMQLSGMTLQHLPIDYREQFGIDAKGIFVSAVQEGSKADLAGVTREDIIATINGKPIQNLKDFYQVVTLLKANSTIELNLKRYSRWRPDRFVEVEIDQPLWVDVESPL